MMIAVGSLAAPAHGRAGTQVHRTEVRKRRRECAAQPAERDQTYDGVWRSLGRTGLRTPERANGAGTGAISWP